MANSENLDLKRLDEPKSTTKFNHQIYYQNNFDKIDAAIGAPPSTLTTAAKTVVPAINELKSDKVDKETGKGLSTNDFDNTYKTKIDVDIPAQLNEKALKTEVGTLASLLTTAKTSLVNAVNELFNNKANKAQESWITPTLLNGWTQIAGQEAAYMKDTLGFVHFKGTVTTGTLPSTIFNLPSGYKPSQPRSFPTVANGLFGRINVSPAGTVVFAAGSASVVYLDGITYKGEI